MYRLARLCTGQRGAALCMGCNAGGCVAVRTARRHATRGEDGDEESHQPPDTHPSSEATKVMATKAQTAANPDAARADDAAVNEEYRFPARDVLEAVRSRDFGKVQSHAAELVQRTWRDEYSVPAACVVVFLITWYWAAWTRRSVRRRCTTAEAVVRQEAQSTVEAVRRLTERWAGDMSRANTQMQGIIDKNSALTADIDRLTTALRSCSIRPTAAASSRARRPGDEAGRLASSSKVTLPGSSDGE